MSAISIKNLTKTYANGTRALKGINLEIQPGDFYALLGANGAGKTTVINILTGLVNKTSGTVEVFGNNIDVNHQLAKTYIGVVPQEFNFNIFETVEDIVCTQAGYYGIHRSLALQEAERLLKRLELWEKRRQPSRNLSGGMKRRLMIARGLIHKPKLLILDEPTAGVDVELRYGMWEYLKELNASGTTILLTTHYLEEVEQMCQFAAIIKEGEIVTNDRVSKLVRLLDKDTYLVSVDQIKNIETLKAFHPKQKDEHTLEVEIDKSVSLNEFILKLTQAGMVITDIRAKGQRLEKLFLSLLKK